MDLKTYLIVTGMLGVSYVTYKYMSKPSVSLLPLDLTQKISQQIKHQVMIVGISYSQAMRKIREDNKEKLKKSGQEVFLQFRNELSTIYLQKQNLIIKKYNVSRDMYARSLDKYRNDKIISRNQVQILEILERAINGQQLDFTIPAQAKQTFKKQKIIIIYKEMVALIGKLVMNKLQQQKRLNPDFNSSNDDDFRKAIRQLSIYDVKIEFLQKHGFKKSWGCPNQVFFKFFESEKLKDSEYNKTAIIYQKTYEKLIELVSQDPDLLTEAKIDQMFEECLKEEVVVVKPKQIKPIQKIIPVQKKVQVRPPPQPKKQQQNQDDYLEELMMQQLMNRSQNEQPVENKAQVVQEQDEQIEVIQSIKTEDDGQKPVQQKQQKQQTQEAFILQAEFDIQVEVPAEQKQAEVVIEQQQKQEQNKEAEFVLQEQQKQEEVAQVQHHEEPAAVQHHEEPVAQIQHHQEPVKVVEAQQQNVQHHEQHHEQHQEQHHEQDHEQHQEQHHEQHQEQHHQEAANDQHDQQ